MKKTWIALFLAVSAVGMGVDRAQAGDAGYPYGLDGNFDGARKPSRKAAPVHLSVAEWEVTQRPPTTRQVAGDIVVRLRPEWTYTGNRKLSPHVRVKGLELSFHMVRKSVRCGPRKMVVVKDLWTPPLLTNKVLPTPFRLQRGADSLRHYYSLTAEGRRGLTDGMEVSGKLFVYVGRRLVKFALPATRLLIPLR